MSFFIGMLALDSESFQEIKKCLKIKKSVVGLEKIVHWNKNFYVHMLNINILSTNIFHIHSQFNKIITYFNNINNYHYCIFNVTKINNNLQWITFIYTIFTHLSFVLYLFVRCFLSKSVNQQRNWSKLVFKK